MDFQHRTWAAVSTDAVAHNYRLLRERLAPSCRVIAVVKADGYGHGAPAVAQALQAAGADMFAVATADEAAELREAGIVRPLLILSYTPPVEAARLAAMNAAVAVADSDHAAALNAAAVAAGVTLDVHIKIDTGMSRLGFVYRGADDTAALDAVAAVCELPALNAVGLFTHFACADEEDERMTRLQFARFEEATRCLRERGVTFALRHCCNSAAALRFPEMQLDAVRPGIVLYGLPPAPWMASLAPLLPALSLRSVVAQVKRVPAGEVVSYGATFATARDTVLATVPVGYADGLPRCAGNHAALLVRGCRAPLVGRVCMDQCLLDVTDIPDVCAGDVVTVFGEGLPTDELAAATETVGYELICRIGKRVPRMYER